MDHATANLHDSRAVANELLRLGFERDRFFTPMQLIKLVYLCHGWMLGLYGGRPLVSEPPAAWKYGPVFPDLYHALKKYGGGPITGYIDDYWEKFDAIETNLIGQVFEKYGHFGGIALSNLTHTPGSPWEITWNAAGSSARIANDLLTEHYGRLARERQAS